ncbi:MAG: WYL domain-containing protein [Thermoleophilia bacterium]
MSTSRIREEGFSKDADKLVRRLSLVALLLSRRGQPVSVSEIRSRVEGYPTMTEEAFKRRFYEDRAELAGLGIEIAAEADAAADGEVYRLPASAYYLPPLELSGQELTALAACLTVLEERFAYSRPLRLALLSLAQGRPELLADAETPPLTVVPETAAVPAVLPRLQAAIAERKTVKFVYYAIGRDEEMERTVDPYGLQLMSGEWYLAGRCHRRAAVRTFRLSRIRSRVTHATRAPHDFATPEGFDIATHRDRPAWRLGEPRGTARIRVDAALAWWVEAHWAHCGRVEHLGGGAIVFETGYADARPLLGWVLGLADAAELLEPVELREQLRGQLRRVTALLAEAPPETALSPAAARAVTGRTRRRRAPDGWRVEVDRFTRLTALATYLLQSCGDDEALLDVADVRAALGLSAEELRADVRLLNLVNFGADGALLYAEYEGRARLRVSCDLAGPAFTRPARLSPLQVDTLLLAVELVGGQLPTATGASLASAAEKLRRARAAASASTLVSSDLLLPADQILDDVNSAILGRRLLAVEYWTEGTSRTTRRTVEPYLLIHSRGEWYYVCWCRKALGQRVFRVATTKSAKLLDETFEPRPGLELDLYRREGIPTSGSYAPKSATIWYSPTVQRWIAERQPVEELADGSCLALQPYVDEQWLTHHLLRFSDQARVLAPPEAVADLRATVGRILALYER